jgi:predicted membrane-bound spermidine synthase
MDVEASAQTSPSELTASETRAPWLLAPCIYVVAFVSGAIVMSFEMLGSRYLAPYFGSGIYTWAALISTVLAALCVGYFIGGSLADRHPSPVLLAATLAIGSAYLVLLPAFADPALEFFVWSIDDIALGGLAAAFAIMFFPVTMLGMFSPFAIRLLLHSQLKSGTVSGMVYGVSTAGSIVGTLGTTFFLIPAIGSRAITYAMGTLGILASGLLVAAARGGRGARAGTLALALVVAGLPFAGPSRAAEEEPFDAAIRAEMLNKNSGLISHTETVYNDIFVGKYENILKMAFQWKGWYTRQSEANLADPDDLPLLYTRAFTIAAIYPPQIKRVLVLGLGGGSIPVYLHRFIPEATIDVVEIDPGIIAAAKKYFGLRETSRLKLIESDGRVFLNRHPEPYDIILVDVFSGSYIPFHMMTKEFYQLLRSRLNPHGVAAINIWPAEKLFVSNVRTLKLAFDTLDFFNSGDPTIEAQSVIVTAPLDPVSKDETAQRAAAAQEHYHFRFDVTRLVEERRFQPPASAKGEILTDDYAPANVFDAYGRRYRRDSQPDEKK